MNKRQLKKKNPLSTSSNNLYKKSKKTYRESKKPEKVLVSQETYNEKKKRIEREKRHKLQEEKRRFLIDKHYNGKIDSTLLKKSWNHIELLVNRLNKIVTADKYLYIGWSDRTKNLDYMDFVNHFKEMTEKEQKTFLEYFMDDKGNSTDYLGSIGYDDISEPENSSDGLTGDTVIHVSSNATRLKKQIRFYETIGYDTILFSNKFTLHGFLTALCCAVLTSRQDNRFHTYKIAKRYLKDFLPDLYTLYNDL